MEKRVLVLDSFYRPIGVRSWQRAVCMLYTGAAEAIEAYDDVLRSPSMTMRMPCVIRVLRKTKTRKQSIKFSRQNVICRDGSTCQYCRKELPAEDLNYDHVWPRSRGGKTNWENVVTSCYPCNSKKGNRTPEEAGMTLLRTPRKPVWLPITAKRYNVYSMPEQWKPYLAAAA